MTMRVLALVTARGGSKGFPGKNLARLAGRELVNWSRRTLQQFQARHPNTVIHLSTDSSSIAQTWPEADRPHQLRPLELATDEATSLDVVLYELDRCAATGQPCDAVLLLQPTSPLVNADDLEGLWQAINAGAEAAIGVVASEHPVQWSYARDDAGRLTPLMGDHSSRRRQELPQAWMPMGIYLTRAETLRR